MRCCVLEAGRRKRCLYILAEAVSMRCEENLGGHSECPISTRLLLAEVSDHMCVGQHDVNEGRMCVGVTASAWRGRVQV
jgi:hypothetical protein